MPRHKSLPRKFPAHKLWQIIYCKTLHFNTLHSKVVKIAPITLRNPKKKKRFQMKAKKKLTASAKFANVPEFDRILFLVSDVQLKLGMILVYS